MTEPTLIGTACVRRGMTVAVVGDGAVGLLGVLSAKQRRRRSPCSVWS
ncbi:MAG: hypothetical protein ACR2KG_09910 [Nocardioidaceae bacterium]